MFDTSINNLNTFIDKNLRYDEEKGRKVPGSPVLLIHSSFCQAVWLAYKYMVTGSVTTYFDWF